MELTPIFELGVAEAYAILSGRFGQADLPPLDAIENEDWGRDLLLSRFQAIPPAELAAAGLTLRGADDEPRGDVRDGPPGLNPVGPPPAP